MSSDGGDSEGSWELQEAFLSVRHPVLIIGVKYTQTGARQTELHCVG